MGVMKTRGFYSVVTQLCAQKGISITALGGELKLSKATTSGWKKGAQPQAKTLKAISEYFGVSIDYLLGLMDDSVTVSQSERMVIPIKGDAVMETDDNKVIEEWYALFSKTIKLSCEFVEYLRKTLNEPEKKDALALLQYLAGATRPFDETIHSLASVLNSSEVSADKEEL